MNTRQQLKQHFGTRTAVITAAVAGFLVGAGGFAAAQIGPEATPAASATVDASSTLDVSARRGSDPLRPTGSAALTGSVVTGGGLTLSVDDPSSTSIPDDPSSTSIPDDSSSTSIPDDSSSTSIPDTSSTVPNSVPDDSSSTSIPDDSSSTSIPDDSSSTSIPDDSSSTSIPDDSSSTSVPDTSSTVPNSTVVPLPGPFTETYSSAGGSITVSWSGTAFSLLAVDAAAGFHAEIEDHAWDRIRVDFEGDDDDARVEVRLNDGRIRVRID